MSENKYNVDSRFCQNFQSIPYELSDEPAPLDWGRWEINAAPGETVVLAVGAMVATAYEAKKLLAERGIDLTVVNARFVQPLDIDCLDNIRESARRILTLEENVLRGGFGQTIGAYLMAQGYRGGFKALGIPDRFVTHGARASLLKEIKLDAEGVADSIANRQPGRVWQHAGQPHQFDE